MNKSIEELNKLYETKVALKRALSALINEQEKELDLKMTEMFSDLKIKFKDHDIDFICRVHSHYDVAVVAIFKNYGTAKEQCITISDYKITEVSGDKDAKFEEAIKMTADFLKELVLQDEKNES